MSSKSFTTSVLTAALFTAVTSLAAAPALAQNYPNTNTPGIDNAQQALNQRIQQGLQQGRISPSEAQALYRSERDIEVREARYKSDGRATPQEREQLRRELGNLNAEVERLLTRQPMNNAGNATPGIDNAEYNIAQRIDEGVRTGRISAREAQMLTRQNRNIERHEATFKADGVVTQSERRQLRNELAQLRDRVERLINPRG